MDFFVILLAALAGYVPLNSLLALVKIYNRRNFKKISLLWGSIFFSILYLGNHILMDYIFDSYFVIAILVLIFSHIVLPTVITLFMEPGKDNTFQASVFYQSLHVFILLSVTVGLLYLFFTFWL